MRNTNSNGLIVGTVVSMMGIDATGLNLTETAGKLDINNSIATTGGTTSVRAKGAIAENGGSTTISANGLKVVSDTSTITLGSTAVSTVAADAPGKVTITNTAPTAAGLTVGTVDGLHGIRADGGLVLTESRTTAGTLTINDNINTGTSDTELIAHDAISDNGTATIAANGLKLVSQNAGITLAHAQVSKIAAQAPGNFNVTNTNASGLTVDNVGGTDGITANQVNLTETQGDLVIGRQVGPTVTGKVVTNGGDITLTSTAGSVKVHRIATNGGGTFTNADPAPTSGTVTINAHNDILDNIDENTTPIDNVYDITANKVTYNAGGNIGGSTDPKSPIETRTNFYGPINTTGNVNLYNKGTLHLDTVSAHNFAITNSGDLYVDKTVTTAVAAAAGRGVTMNVIDDPDLFINAGITSGGGAVALSATGRVVHDLNGSVATDGGTFTGTAYSAGSGVGFGQYILQSGSQIDTTGLSGNGAVTLSGKDVIFDTALIKAGNADVTIKPTVTGETIALNSATGDFSLSQAEVNNIHTTGTVIVGANGAGGAGNVVVDNLTRSGGNIQVLTNGSITSQGTDTVPSITTGTLTLNAGTGIDLGTSVDTLTATNTVGNILINEANGITLKDIHTTTSGNITVNSGVVAPGDMLVTSVNAAGGAAGNNVTLLAKNGKIDTTGATPMVTADTLNATADGLINLNTTVNTLNANARTPGNISINETNAIDLNNVVTNNGAISVTAGGQINATNVNSSNTNSAANGVTLTTTAGDIDVGTIAAAALADASLTAQGSINDIAPGSSISAKGLEAVAQTGNVNLGDTRVSNLAVKATSGTTSITNTKASGLTVTQVGGTTGIKTRGLVLNETAGDINIAKDITISGAGTNVAQLNAKGSIKDNASGATVTANKLETIAQTGDIDLAKTVVNMLAVNAHGDANITNTAPGADLTVGFIGSTHGITATNLNLTENAGNIKVADDIHVTNTALMHANGGISDVAGTETVQADKLGLTAGGDVLLHNTNVNTLAVQDAGNNVTITNTTPGREYHQHRSGR